MRKKRTSDVEAIVTTMTTTITPMKKKTVHRRWRSSLHRNLCRLHLHHRSIHPKLLMLQCNLRRLILGLISLPRTPWDDRIRGNQSRLRLTLCRIPTASRHDFMCQKSCMDYRVYR